MRSSFIFPVLAGLMMFTSVAHAGLLLDLQPGSGPAFPCGGICSSDYGTTLGWSFTIEGPVALDGLGMWEYGSDSLVATQVGLWTEEGELLRSATVSGSSAAVTSANTGGRWRMESIEVVYLSPGEYLLGAFLYPSAPTLQFLPCVTDPRVTSVGAAGAPYGFTAPVETGPGLVFGPTAQTVDAVPEPAALGPAAAGLALLAAAWRTRRRGRVVGR